MNFFTSILDVNKKVFLNEDDLKCRENEWILSEQDCMLVPDCEPEYPDYIQINTYHKYFLAFWPKTDIYQVMLKSDIEQAVDYLCDSMSCKSAEYINNVRDLVRVVTEKQQNETTSLKILEIVASLNILDLVRLFISAGIQKLTKKISARLAPILVTFGWNTLKDSMTTITQLDCLDNALNNCHLVKVYYLCLLKLKLFKM